MGLGHDPSWWRQAVVYQIYPRSFADANGDGEGDIRGMIDHLDHVAGLGADAVWVSPWYPSPLRDGGYDVADYYDVAPVFGTLADADEFVARAHDLGLRVLIDLVPNHTSAEHPWFPAALAAGPGSAERERYVFRDGRGPDGAEPPSNWVSEFGGSTWERVPDGQWYLHTFDVSQPDLNWANEEVRAEFDRVLRFWFDRGVDGFRIDVADSIALDPTTPDVPVDEATGVASMAKFVGHPRWDRPELADIHARWRAIADEYADRPGGPRVFVSEAYLAPPSRLVAYVRPGQLHTTFNFDPMECAWEPASLRAVIDASIRAHAEVGAPPMWVLGNHDVVRVATRYGKADTGGEYAADGTLVPGTFTDPHLLLGTPTDERLGLQRARAAALLDLALPGGAYIYQGEELGLPEIEDLPDAARQDPAFFRTQGEYLGRDGCRVPLPWRRSGPSLGFGPGGSWLPQPVGWGELSVEAQDTDVSSTLSMYRNALRERRRNPALGDGALAWTPDADDGVLDFTREPGFRCVVNLSGADRELPRGSVLLASGPLPNGRLPNDTTVWLGD